MKPATLLETWKTLLTVLREKDNQRMNAHMLLSTDFCRNSHETELQQDTLTLYASLPIETQSPRRVTNSLLAQFVIFLFGKINSFFIFQPC